MLYIFSAIIFKAQHDNTVMNQDTQQTQKFVKVAFMAFAFIFSLVAAILVFATDFGGWWLGGGYSNYYYWLGSEIAGFGSKIPLILLGLLFLVLAGVSVFLGILTLIDKEFFLGKLSSFKILSFGGVAGAIAGFLLTILAVIILFVIAGDYEVLWLDAGFYGPLIGSLLVGIFFILYVVLGNIMKPAKAAE